MSAVGARRVEGPEGGLRGLHRHVGSTARYKEGGVGLKGGD
jgi:hypothetical protein